MLFFDTILVALKSLLSNRLRSFLSMLGIIIGVAAVITVIAISSGAEKQVLDRLNNLGTNLILVTPGVSRGGGGRVSQEVSNVFKYEMAEQIQAMCPDIEKITSYIDGNVLAIYENINLQSRIRATTNEFFSMVDLSLARGRFFADSEKDESRSVVILGSEIAENLFGSVNPLGKSLKLSRGKSIYTMTVVGVLAAKGQVMFSNYDNQIFLPITTYMNRFQTTNYVNGFAAQAKSSELAATAVQEIEYLLYQKMGDLDKFRVTSQTEMLSMASDYTKTFKILLTGIASIALLVGGIGIMNITLVSVTERTREIGIRKALGAKKRVILFQFLIESCTVSAAGGLMGIALGIIGATIIAKLGSWALLITPGSAIIAFSFSMFIGLFFGIYPASRAASLDPVEALSYE